MTNRRPTAFNSMNRSFQPGRKPVRAVPFLGTVENRLAYRYEYSSGDPGFETVITKSPTEPSGPKPL